VVGGYRCEENSQHGSGSTRAGEDRLGRARPGTTGGEADSEGGVQGARQGEHYALADDPSMPAAQQEPNDIAGIVVALSLNG
jgi:hypothetical protein